MAQAFGGADAATKAFADKLARKLGWSSRFALRAVAEYRKFVYLGMVSDFPVTPSKVIDQVWHEHQLFTQAYRRFCDELLGRHFDHHPELIPADEQLANYEAQYRATLALYQQEFNQDPPPEIWLVPKFREDKRRQPRHATSPSDVSTYGDAPLYTFFESDAGSGGFDAFDGGQSGGGGGGAEWSDSGGADTGSSDAGGDSGGGSSCSSGCSGGGGD